MAPPVSLYKIGDVVYERGKTTPGVIQSKRKQYNLNSYYLIQWETGEVTELAEYLLRRKPHDPAYSESVARNKALEDAAFKDLEE